MAIGRAATDMRDAQVARVDKADELRRLMVEQRVGADRIGGSAPPALLLMPLRTGQGSPAQRAGANKFHQRMPLRVGARLLAGLKMQLDGGLSGLGNRARIFNSRGQRRFAIDMLPRLQRGDNNILVEMRRRRHKNALDLFLFQKLSIIRKALRIGR